MTEGLIKHTQRRVCPVKDAESHCYGSGCQADLLDLEGCCSGTLKGFPLAGWCRVRAHGWVQHEPPETRGDSPGPLQCRDNIFQEVVEPPKLPSKPSTGSSVLPHTSQISASRNPRLQGFLCLAVGNLWSLWWGLGSMQAAVPLKRVLPGIKMALHPTPSSHSPTNMHCVSVQCVPDGSDQLDGTQKLPRRPQC